MAKQGVQVAIVIVVVAAAFAIGRRSEKPAASSSDVAPRVGFRPAEIDLGDQLWGTTIPVELTFVNNGETPLTVASAKSSCACVVLDNGALENRTVKAKRTGYSKQTTEETCTIWYGCAPPIPCSGQCTETEFPTGSGAGAFTQSWLGQSCGGGET